MPSEENDGGVSSSGKGEDLDKWLIEETERFESEKRELEADVSSDQVQYLLNLKK